LPATLGIDKLEFIGLSMRLFITELAEKHQAERFLVRSSAPPGRLLAIDLGAKRIGVAVCDDLRISIRSLTVIERRSWKDLLRRVLMLIETNDAKGLVIGLPLNLDGEEGHAAKETRTIADKFRRSLSVPVFLQDERLTTLAAKSALKGEGLSAHEVERAVDSEAAAIILRDFIISNVGRSKLNHR
jgi:putative Holliday junction resolvase